MDFGSWSVCRVLPVSVPLSFSLSLQRASLLGYYITSFPLDPACHPGMQQATGLDWFVSVSQLLMQFRKCKIPLSFIEVAIWVLSHFPLLFLPATLLYRMTSVLPFLYGASRTARVQEIQSRASLL